MEKKASPVTSAGGLYFRIPRRVISVLSNDALVHGVFFPVSPCRDTFYDNAAAFNLALFIF